MSPVVAVIAPGLMGAGVGQRLSENGVTVVTSLKGRSAESAKRAAAARMADASDDEIARADVILSIVPPGDALGLAERLAPPLTASRKKPVYVDCNAISPQTVDKIAAVIAKTGCAFVDAGIIGPPPETGKDGWTKFYCSGPDTARFTPLGDHGLKVIPIEGPLSAASALKMSYGGITKGMTAIAAAMILAATRGGSSKALLAELNNSFMPAPWLTRQIPAMYHRAYRWVDEMEEVAQFVGDDTAAREMYLAMARVYQEIADDYEGAKRDTGAMTAFFKPDGK